MCLPPLHPQRTAVNGMPPQERQASNWRGGRGAAITSLASLIRRPCIGRGGGRGGDPAGAHRTQRLASGSVRQVDLVHAQREGIKARDLWAREGTPILSTGIGSESVFEGRPAAGLIDAVQLFDRRPPTAADRFLDVASIVLSAQDSASLRQRGRPCQPHRRRLESEPWAVH